MYFDLKVKYKNTKFCKIDISSKLKKPLRLEIRQQVENVVIVLMLSLLE
jgi:hypothetical protein